MLSNNTFFVVEQSSSALGVSLEASDGQEQDDNEAQESQDGIGKVDGLRSGVGKSSLLVIIRDSVVSINNINNHHNKGGNEETHGQNTANQQQGSHIEGLESGAENETKQENGRKSKGDVGDD